MIVFIHQNAFWRTWYISIFKCHNNYFLAFFNQMTSSTIHTNNSWICFTTNHIGLQSRTRSIAYDKDFFVFSNIYKIHQRLVDSNTTNIFEICFRYRRLMYFWSKKNSHGKKLFKYYIFCFNFFNTSSVLPDINIRLLEAENPIRLYRSYW